MSRSSSRLFGSGGPVRHRVAAWVAGVVSVLAMVGVVGPIGASPAAAAAAAAPVAGPHLFKPQHKSAVTPAVLTGPLFDYGGVVQTAPQVYVDFWGWTSDPKGEAQYLVNFLQSVGGTPWLATVNQYGGGSNTGLLAGAWHDPTPIPNSPTDAQIRGEVLAAINHFGAANSPNVQIVIATPTGHSSPGFGAGGYFCAYHDFVSNLQVTYTNLPYQTDAGSTCGENEVNSGSAGTLDGVSISEGHELAETITNPFRNAWGDTSGEEIGDKCESGVRDVALSGSTFAMQPLWSNAAGGCVMSSPRWSDWVSEIGAPPPGLAPGSSPVVTTWGVNRLDVFARGSDNAVWHAWWDGARWNPWESLGGAIVSNPAAVSWAPGRIDLYGVGTDGNLRHQWYDGTWSNWVNDISTPPRGLAPGSSPVVTTWGVNHLDVFARGSDNSLWHASWDGTRWNPWESLGGTLGSDPAAVSWAPGRIDLYGVGGDGNLWHQWYDGTWSGWVNDISTPPRGLAPGSSPVVTTRGVNHLDVFARGNDNALWHTWWDGTRWSRWQSQGPTIISSPTAVAGGPNLFDVFGVGTDNNVRHKFYGNF